MALSSRITRRRAAAVVALSGITALVTACGSISPSAAPGGTGGTPGQSATSSPASSTPVSTPASSPSSSSPGSSGSTGSGSSGSGSAGTDGSTSGAPAGCLTRYLRADASGTQGTAGSVYVAIVFTNLNNQSCTLYGYPGVSFAAGTPVRQVGIAAVRNPSPGPALVTLPPHGTANALLQIVDAGNYSAAQCRPESTPWLQVYPPNQTAQLYVHYTARACAGSVRLLTVSVVQPGSAPKA